MVLVVKGEVTLTGKCTGTIKPGQAIHLVGEASCFAENRTATEVVYVIAAGMQAADISTENKREGIRSKK